MHIAGLASSAIGAPVDALVVKFNPVDAVPMASDGLSANLVEQFIVDAEADAAAAVEMAKTVFYDWAVADDSLLIESMGQLANVVGQFGRTHGLTVVACGSNGVSAADAIDAALFETGRPVLIAPQHDVLSLGKRVAIFWNDSPEAARAVWGAFPFLRQAEQINIFAVAEDFDAEAGLDRLVQGLARAGVHAQPKPLRSDDRDASVQLRDAAASMDADLVVMGAFTHSRLRELVLGGVTKNTLAGVSHTTFLAH